MLCLKASRWERRARQRNGIPSLWHGGRDVRKAPSGDRTHDRTPTERLLNQLSYGGPQGWHNMQTLADVAG